MSLSTITKKYEEELRKCILENRIVFRSTNEYTKIKEFILSSLKSAIETAFKETKVKDMKERHICWLNDGVYDCNCYMAALYNVKQNQEDFIKS